MTQDSNKDSTNNQVNSKDPTTTTNSTDVEEFKELIDFINDLKSKDEVKKVERELNNINTIANNPVDLSRLDSSIKKNSAFVKKLKNLTETTKDSVLKDVTTLNISKYLTEVVAALVELKLKASDIPMYLEVCSKIHRIYPEFPSLFLEQWQKSLPKTIQDIVNYYYLRIFSELILIGIFSLKDSLQLLGNLLKLLLSEKQSINLNVVLNFCKNCGWYYAGLISRRMIQLAHKHKEQIPCSSFLSPERQKGLRTLLKDYYNQICKQIIADHLALKRREYENKQVLITRGELSEKKKNIYEENKANFLKLWSSVQQLGELLNEDLPELKNDDPDDDLENQALLNLLNIDSSSIKINSIDVPLWEDENQRIFYEQLPNLKNEIPAHLYKDSIKERYQKTKKEESKHDKMDRLENKELLEKMELIEKIEQKKQEEELTKMNAELSDEVLAKNLTKELVNDESEDESDNIENALNKLQLDSDDEDSKVIKKPVTTQNGKASVPISKDQLAAVAKITLDELLNMLLNCTTKETIDKAAFNFSINFNTKSNRKKLIRALFTCPRTRLDLLPFFARFVAIINPIMPLVGADLVYLLKKDFRFHLNKKDQINIESKIKTIRFIGELTKFNIFPKDEAMQCLKILILDFSHHQIEMACNLLEVCGRYLYLSPATHIKFNLLLQQMLRKKTLIPIQTKYIAMIENAYYNSCPNLQNATGQSLQNDFRQPDPDELLSDSELYFKYLIQKELDRANLEKVLNLIRKFDYTDKNFVNFAVKCLSEVWFIKYFNIKYLANCISALATYQPVIGHRVVDSVLEEIRLMIEINSIKYNQRRVAVVKCLGELYNYRLIDSSVIINALYLLISYGVNPNYELFDFVLKEKASKLAACEQEKVTSSDDSSKLKRSKSLTDLQEINEKLMQHAESELDTADNLIRVRLICVLLDTCVPYINTASGKRKLECFILFFQLYFYRKKIIYLLNEEKEDAVFPVEIEFAFVDSVRRVRPKFKFSKNYNDAFIELLKLVEKLAPKIEKLLPKNKPTTTVSNLKVINEIDEEEEDESEQEFDEEEELDDEDLVNSDQTDEEDLNNPSQESVENQKSFDNLEEDEFQREFDQIMSESLMRRSNENVRNLNTDIVIPISKLNNLNNNNERQFAPLITSLNSNQSIAPILNRPDAEKTINVVVMTKSKNNKQILKSVQVPLESDFAKSLKEKEQAEKEEKEKVKKLTLDINERREMEDEERSNITPNVNINREGRRKLNHFRGVVPTQEDLNQIFGTTRKK